MFGGTTPSDASTAAPKLSRGKSGSGTPAGSGGSSMGGIPDRKKTPLPPPPPPSTELRQSPPSPPPPLPLLPSQHDGQQPQEEEEKGVIGELLDVVVARMDGRGGAELLANGIAGVGVEGEAAGGGEPGTGRTPSLLANHGFQVRACVRQNFVVVSGQQWC